MKNELEPLDGANSEAVEHIARLHTDLLPGSPIARLGLRFMKQFYYRLLIADGLIGCQLSYVDGEPAGFIVYTNQPSRFMVEGLRRHWLFLSGVLLREILADPRRLRVVLWTLNYMRRSDRPAEPGEGEILSFGVVPKFRNSRFLRLTGRHLSMELFASATDFFRSEGIERYRAVVESGNREALMFYHAQGCHPKQDTRDAPERIIFVCRLGHNSEEPPTVKNG